MEKRARVFEATQWFVLAGLVCLVGVVGCDRDGREAPKKAPKEGSETPGGKAPSPVPESTTGAPIDKLEAILESIQKPVDEAEVDTYIDKMETFRESDAFQSWAEAYEGEGSGEASSGSMKRHGLPLVREIAKHFESAPSVNTYPLVLQVGALAVGAEYVAQKEGFEEPASDEVARAMLDGQSAANSEFEARRQAFADDIANPETSSSSDYAQALAQAPSTAEKMAPLFVYGRLPRASIETWQGLEAERRRKVLELADMPEAGIDRSPIAASALSVENSVKTVLTYQLASAAEKSDGAGESTDAGKPDAE